LLSAFAYAFEELLLDSSSRVFVCQFAFVSLSLFVCWALRHPLPVWCVARGCACVEFTFPVVVAEWLFKSANVTWMSFAAVARFNIKDNVRRAAFFSFILCLPRANGARYFYLSFA